MNRRTLFTVAAVCAAAIAVTIAAAQRNAHPEQALIDAFFDGVMAMVDDATLLDNRIAFLARVKARFDVIA